MNTDTPSQEIPTPRATVASAEMEVALIGMQFHVCVGILPHEQDIPQPLQVDLSVRHAGQAVVDYRSLYEATRLVMDERPLSYLESIAESLAQRVLGLEHVTWCRIVIRKPHVALGGPLDHARITIERSRG